VPILLRSPFTASAPFFSLLAAFWTAQVCSASFPLPPVDVDLIGQTSVVAARHEDTLLDIARRFDIGQDEIVLANAEVDRWLPGEGTEVLIPSRYILPAAQRSGIVLNVPEMRVYYFPPPKAGSPARVETYPVSIGRMNWTTPLGTTKVVAKKRDPAWRPPASIRAEAVEKGTPLPEYVPPGPDNPLGRYAIRLGIPGYLIHSTNKPFGVGMRVSHGCVRMYPEDIEELFPEVPVGTPVQIVDQPVKIGWLFDTLYIEIHPLLEEERETSAPLLEFAMDLINAEWEKRRFILDGQALKAALQQLDGLPKPIAKARNN